MTVREAGAEAEGAPGDGGCQGAPRLRVGVLMGGPSRERAVSLRTGAAVARALAGCGHRVEWLVIGPEETEPTWLGQVRVDVFFIALHGALGEDGQVQRQLEALGRVYTGSGPLASARAFDKVQAKVAFERAGIPTPAWISLEAPLPPVEALEAQLAPLGRPVVLKPVSEGSSIGVRIVDDRAGIEVARRELHGLGGGAVAEAFVPGRELTVGILCGHALPPVEVRCDRRFYDYEAKYDPLAGTRYDDQPTLAPALEAKIRQLALRAHRALGCRGATRVDVRLDPTRGPFVLEVNTIPGMTPQSLLPKAARRAGLAFGALCERILQAALRGAAQRAPQAQATARPHADDPARHASPLGAELERRKR